MSVAEATPPPSSIRRLPDGSFQLELRGTFPPDWAGTLCARLSARRISVERAVAKQVQRGRWESMFVLRPLDPVLDTLQLDYLAMALAPKARATAARPVIGAYTLDDRGDALVVSIRAADALGLLGQLLGAFSYLMLFVHEMQIETVGAEAQDAFVLKGLAGAAPGTDRRVRLAAALQAMSGARRTG